VTRSSPPRPSTSTNRAAHERTSAHARAHATELLLLAEFHADLPVGLLVNDAKTLQVLHASSTMLELVDTELTPEALTASRNGASLHSSELAASIANVASTGNPHYLPQFRHEALGQPTRWWSLSLARADTDNWGTVVLTLAVDITDQTHARRMLEERGRRQAALRQAIDVAPGTNLVHSLMHVVGVLVSTLPIDVATIRLLDEHGKLHLVAAAGFRPSEIRKLAQTPLEAQQLKEMLEGNPLRLGGPLGLRYVEARWLGPPESRLGTLKVGARSERQLSDDDLTLLTSAAAQLHSNLQTIERTPHTLRGRSLELSRANAEGEREKTDDITSTLRPRELAILRLYGEGLRTHQIAELLVLSTHTVRTHVKNALRRLGVNARRDALELLERIDIDPPI
jgi:DNA-binding CsgD family transcriptional regulator